MHHRADGCTFLSSHISIMFTSGRSLIVLYAFKWPCRLCAANSLGTNLAGLRLSLEPFAIIGRGLNKRSSPAVVRAGAGQGVCFGRVYVVTREARNGMGRPRRKRRTLIHAAARVTSIHPPPVARPSPFSVRRASVRVWPIASGKVCRPDGRGEWEQSIRSARADGQRHKHWKPH